MRNDIPPRITVFMPAFNVGRYIAAAIESVLAQTCTDFELLLIDDGSIDDTPRIMQHYAGDARVRIVSHRHNQGRPATRNEGLDRARGEYIALLDADDACAPDRLRRQAAYLAAHPEIAVLGSGSHRIDAAGQPLTDGRREPATPDAIAADMLFRCPIHQPTVMARTSVLAAYRYDACFCDAEDYELWARMAGAGCRFANLPQRLTFYRRHSEQATTATEKAIERDWHKIYARQLDALEVAYTADDLRYHALLHRGRRQFRACTGRAVDLAYVRWARRWLEKLLAANAATGCYPEPAFSRAVGRLWWFICRKAARPVGTRIWREFVRAPLKRALVSAWLENAGDWAQRRFARRAAQSAEKPDE